MTVLIVQGNVVETILGDDGHLGRRAFVAPTIRDDRAKRHRRTKRKRRPVVRNTMGGILVGTKIAKRGRPRLLGKKAPLGAHRLGKPRRDPETTEPNVA